MHRVTRNLHLGTAIGAGSLVPSLVGLNASNSTNEELIDKGEELESVETKYESSNESRKESLIAYQKEREGFRRPFDTDNAKPSNITEGLREGSTGMFQATMSKLWDVTQQRNNLQDGLIAGQEERDGLQDQLEEVRASLGDELQAVGNKLKDVTQQYNNLKADFRDAKEQLGRARGRRDELQQQLNTLGARLDNMAGRLEDVDPDLEGRFQSTDAKLEIVIQQRASDHNQLLATKEELNGAWSKYEDIRKELFACREECDMLQRQLNTAKAQLKNGVEQFEQELRQGLEEEFRSKKEELNTDQRKLHTDQEKLTTDQQKLKTNQDKLKIDQDHLKTDRAKLETEHDSLKEDQDKLKAEQDTLEANKEEFKKEFENEKEELRKEFEAKGQEREDELTKEFEDRHKDLETEFEDKRRELKKGEDKLRADQDKVQVDHEKLQADSKGFQKDLDDKKRSLETGQDSLKAQETRLAEEKKKFKDKRESVKARLRNEVVKLEEYHKYLATVRKQIEGWPNLVTGFAKLHDLDIGEWTREWAEKFPWPKSFEDFKTDASNEGGEDGQVRSEERGSRKTLREKRETEDQSSHRSKSGSEES